MRNKRRRRDSNKPDFRVQSKQEANKHPRPYERLSGNRKGYIKWRPRESEGHAQAKQTKGRADDSKAPSPCSGPLWPAARQAKVWRTWNPRMDVYKSIQPRDEVPESEEHEHQIRCSGACSRSWQTGMPHTTRIRTNGSPAPPTCLAKSASRDPMGFQYDSEHSPPRDQVASIGLSTTLACDCR
jgi:hypothetical protein